MDFMRPAGFFKKSIKEVVNEDNKKKIDKVVEEKKEQPIVEEVKVVEEKKPEIKVETTTIMQKIKKKIME